MPSYEISIPDDGHPDVRMTVSVDADHWMAAVIMCLDEVTGGFSIEHAVCELQPDRSVHVTDRATGLYLTVRELEATLGIALPDARRREGTFAEQWFALQRTGTFGPRRVVSDSGFHRRAADQPDRERTPITRPRVRRRPRMGPRRRDTDPMLPALDGGDGAQLVDRIISQEVAVRRETTRPGLKTPLPRPRPVTRDVAGSIDELLDSLRDMDDRRKSAEQLIDRAVELVSHNVACSGAQFLMGEHRGGFRVIAARGSMAGDVVLRRTTFDAHALEGWTRHARHAVQVQQPRSFKLRYAGRGESTVDVSVGLVLLVPVCKGPHTIGALLLFDAVGVSPFDARTLACVSELGRRLGAGLGTRL